MKLNIEELAREAFFSDRDLLNKRSELEAFTRLIVERCAETANESLTKGRSPHGARVAAEIRKLLVDE